MMALQSNLGAAKDLQMRLYFGEAELLLIPARVLMYQKKQRWLSVPWTIRSRCQREFLIHDGQPQDQSCAFASYGKKKHRVFDGERSSY